MEDIFTWIHKYISLQHQLKFPSCLLWEKNQSQNNKKCQYQGNSEKCPFLVTTGNISGNYFHWSLNKNFKSRVRKKKLYIITKWPYIIFHFYRNQFNSFFIFQFMSFFICSWTINCPHMLKSEIITSFIFIMTIWILLCYCSLSLILYCLLTFHFYLLYSNHYFLSGNIYITLKISNLKTLKILQTYSLVCDLPSFSTLLCET